VPALGQPHARVVHLALGATDQVRPEEGVGQQDVDDDLRPRTLVGATSMYACRPTQDATEELRVTTSEAEVLELSGERTPVRQLVGDVIRHDYRSRYRSASLGLAWSVALPLLQGVVIAIVFSALVGGGKAKTYVPYVIAGMAAWSFLSTSISAASTTIVDGGAIAGRLYFPRLLLPAIPPTANLPGMIISLVIAEIINLGAGNPLHLSLLLLPALVVLAWVFVVSVSAVLSMMHVYSRDVRYVVQALTLILFYAAPIIYGLSARAGRRALPASLRPYVLANPATGIVQLSRYALTGHADYVGTALIATGAWTLLFVVLVLVVYSRFERISVDRL
jgi:ABC-type polysaccharide/polyol phosphate export permease